MTFAEKVIHFTESLRPDWKVPEGVGVLYPYDQAETMDALSAFYRKYYDDNEKRIFIFGINPGRFGAAITGVPFTDPIRLQEVCGIVNGFKKRPELSSVFVYEFIAASGGPHDFYRDFYITSLSPLGFIKDGKNYNYYDDRQLEKAVEPYIIDNIETQLKFGLSREVALCLGMGKNYQYFEKLNARHRFFDHLIPLPHPRWVMQYRQKQMEAFVAVYLEALGEARELANL